MRKRGLVLMVAALCVLTAQAQPQKRDVDLKAQDGTLLKATYFAAAKPGPGVILLHMCNSQRKAWDNLAAMLAARGIHALTMDYRGYGESGGKPFAEMTPQERRQAQQNWGDDIYGAYKFLAAQPGVDRARIGAGGGSCGVENALQLARRVDIRTLVLLAGGASQPSQDFLAESAWLPVFASASRDDGNAVDAMQWLLGFSSNPANVLKGYQTGGHGTDMFPVHKDLEPAIAAWFEQYLVKTPVQASSKIGPPGPSAQLTEQLRQPGGAAQILPRLREARQAGRFFGLPPEGAINAMGYEFLQGGRAPDAVALFELNVDANPNSANAYDSLSDAYLAVNNREKALEFARKALEVLPRDTQASEAFKQQIRESAEGKIRQLSGGVTAPPARPPAEQVLRMPIVLTVPGMENAKVHKDVTYKTVDGVELEMDVYVPPTASAGARVPVVLFIGGGGNEGDPSPKDWGGYRTYGQLMTASGMAGVEFNKRYTRDRVVAAASRIGHERLAGVSAQECRLVGD